MSEETTQKTSGYEVVTVEKTSPPDGLAGDNWYRYVIIHKGSTIEGQKQGTLKTVSQHAQSVVEDLNERDKHFGSTYASRRPQKN